MKDYEHNLGLTSDNTEVLDGLKDTLGVNVKKWMLKALSEPPSLLIVMGRPGAGKTTIINQALREHAHRNISSKIGIVSFDVARSELLRDFGQEDTLSWKVHEWQELNDRLIKRVEDTKATGKNVLFECVG